MTRNQVRGMFLGIAVGDALGKPVEMWKIDKIAKVHGRVTKYHSCDGHKFFDGHEVGTITDDTILSMAVAKALIEGGEDMEVHAKYHALALDHAMGGWGNTTKEALRKLKNGVSWSESGKNEGKMRGTGNGVAMKVLPYAAYCVANKVDIHTKFLEDLALMTHYTDMGIASGAAMVRAGEMALEWSADFIVQNRAAVASNIVNSALWGEVVSDKANVVEEKLSDDLATLYHNVMMTPEEIVKTFGAGSCYIKHSIPFTLAFWLRNPGSIETVYDLASAGGDTDSNCSMGAGLVGAVSGERIFPAELTDNLKVKDEILDLADRFCDRFAIT